MVVPPSEPLLALPPEMLFIGPQAESVSPRPSSVPPLLVPAGTTTMVGLALPPSLLQASAQFEQGLPVFASGIELADRADVEGADLLHRLVVFGR